MIRLALASLAIVVVGCSKPPCPQKFQADAPAECACAGAGKGTVWGTGIYTTDSNLCSAAIHAGAIPASGGNVKPRSAPACPGYLGTVANGITTSNWGSYGGSFFFEGHGSAKCSDVPAPKPTGVAQGGACPSRLAGFVDAETATTFACTCGAPAAGSVYGTNVYTTDSNLCAAAVHAGAVPATGGAIKAIKTAGCPKYVGTAANGISTSNWGSYGSSYYFEGRGDGKCAD